MSRVFYSYASASAAERVRYLQTGPSQGDLQSDQVKTLEDLPGPKLIQSDLQARTICDGKSLVLPKTCAPSCLEKMLYCEIYSDSERRASTLLVFSSQPIRNQPGGALTGF